MMARRQKFVASRRIAVSSRPTRDSDFAEFGEIVHNPALHEPTSNEFQSTSANQGSATKWLNVTNVVNHYDLAPSRIPAKPVMNMFVCEPRELLHQDGTHLFPVGILERHPFTSQTFIPLGVDPDDADTRYLVIVAPTLPASSHNDLANASPEYPVPSLPHRKSLLERFWLRRSSLSSNGSKPTTEPQPLDRHGRSMAFKGPGNPDLDNLRAFVLRGDQAVTYGAGTWHAPMVVLGRRMIDFVVVQHANGVALEDCQEILIGANDGGRGITVDVGGSKIPRAKL
jgi:ureidoglycolate lyase